MGLQALALSAALVLVALTSAHVVAMVLPGLVFGWWLFLTITYGKALERDPPEARKLGDRQVIKYTVLATVPPLATAIVMEATGTFVWDDTPVCVAIVAFAALWLGLYASTLVDWYYILPRRDGLIGDPPCHGSRDRWIGITRIWFTHRALAGVVGAAAIVVTTTAFAFKAFPAKDKVGSVLLTSAASGLVFTRLLYGNLTTIGDVISRCCLSPPDIVMGDHLVGPEDFRGGYVRDVSLEGISVIRLSARGKTFGFQRQLKRHSVADVLDKPAIEGKSFAPCRNGCIMVNDRCQWHRRNDALADRINRG